MEGVEGGEAAQSPVVATFQIGSVHSHASWQQEMPITKVDLCRNGSLKNSGFFTDSLEYLKGAQINIFIFFYNLFKFWPYFGG